MTSKWMTSVVSVLIAVTVSLPAQQNGADRKLFEDTKAKAEKGDVMAQLDLGLEYEAGNAIPQDFAEALKWYRKSADQGNDISALMLAQMYSEGRGVDKSLDEAAKWFRKAAEKNFAIAEFDLGTCYSFGNGV